MYNIISLVVMFYMPGRLFFIIPVYWRFFSAEMNVVVFFGLTFYNAIGMWALILIVQQLYRVDMFKNGSVFGICYFCWNLSRFS